MRLQQIVTVVGVHAEGEVGRVITGGVIAPRAASMFERQQAFIRDQDWLRGMLLSDPRGSVNAAVNLVTPPIDPQADVGMIVIESDYYPPMSGSNLMCAVTAVLETGMLAMVEPVTRLCVDTPAGLVYVEAECGDGKCRRVSFRNVPAFVMHRDRQIEVPGFGTITVDVSYGGMIYVIASAEQLGLTLAKDEARALVETGERIKLAAADQLPSVHPENPGIHTINQTLIAGPLRECDGVKTSKNAVIVSPGRIDRSPCGTGSSARMALMHARGELAVGERFVHQSILDTEFACSIEDIASVGGLPAVVTRVGGRAWLTGVSYYGADPEDPFPHGYRLNDTWLAC
ncbi:proline racemase family protein [Sphingomonas sp. JC676]|uniref:proline racemase family protein n=1 Tax=Sphingomonas sp. JC676 TaxID=2768065 RepID=UPI001657BDA6|nr:proline racemase family protein [Sphingomonas sp. JC676]MBC9033727.1 proline racemase family protein [Sphingomonas sp. JC676]